MTLRLRARSAQFLADRCAKMTLRCGAPVWDELSSQFAGSENKTKPSLHHFGFTGGSGWHAGCSTSE
jgi:hypothetical protein